MTRRHAYWLCQIGGWTTYAVVQIALSALFIDLGWGHVGMNVISGGVGLFYTHLYRLFIRRHGWTRLSLHELAPRVLLASLVVGAAMHLTFAPIGRYLLGLDAHRGIGSDVGFVLVAIGYEWVVILLWSLIYFGVHFFWGYRQAEVDKWRLEAQAEAARLEALKLQLNPHFFFNSLNSVRGLIAEDPARAQRMVTRLARLFRNTLQVDDVKTIPLEEELSTVRTYLELEKVRFEGRLQYRIEATEEALRWPVPFLLVQTLAENGIKHGISECPGGGTIAVEAQVQDDALRLRVANPGVFETEKEGTGLSNARERLELLFGGEATLTLENAGANTVEAIAVLPRRDALDKQATGNPAKPPNS